MTIAWTTHRSHRIPAKLRILELQPTSDGKRTPGGLRDTPRRLPAFASGVALQEQPETRVASAVGQTATISHPPEACCLSRRAVPQSVVYHWYRLNEHQHGQTTVVDSAELDTQLTAAMFWFVRLGDGC